MDGFVGPMFDRGLTKLKGIVEREGEGAGAGDEEQGAQ